MGQVSKVDAGENLDAEIGSDASNLNRGTVLGLGCDGGTKRGGSSFVGHEGYLLKNPALPVQSPDYGTGVVVEWL